MKRREPRENELTLIHVTKQRFALVNENYDATELQRLFDSLPYVPGLVRWKVSQAKNQFSMKLDARGNLIPIDSEMLKRLRGITSCEFSILLQDETVSNNHAEWQGKTLILETTPLTAWQNLSPLELTTLADLEQRAAIALMGQEPPEIEEPPKIVQKPTLAAPKWFVRRATALIEAIRRFARR